MTKIHKPTDLWREIRKIKADIRVLRHAARLGSAAISAGQLVITDFGKIVVQDDEANDLIYVGPTFVAGVPAGYGFLAITPAGATFANISTDENQQPIVGFRDSGGNLVFSLDVPAQQGLARPFIPHPTPTPNDSGLWAKTTSTSWVEISSAWSYAQHPKMNVVARTAKTAGDGQYRITLNGTPISDTYSIDQAVNVNLALPASIGHMESIHIAVEARVTSGSGYVAVQVLRVFGEES